MSYSCRSDWSHQFQWDGRTPVERGGLENELSTPPKGQTKLIRTVVYHCSVTPVLGLESTSCFLLVFGFCLVFCFVFFHGEI